MAPVKRMVLHNRVSDYHLHRIPYDHPVARDSPLKPNISTCFYTLIFTGAAMMPAPANAQRVTAESGYPAKALRFIVPQAAGGSNDTMARYVAHYLSDRLGKPVVIDNRPGADGIIGTDIAARSAPDGHTLLLASAAYVMNPSVRKVPYDPQKAFDWVAMLGNGPTVLTIGPSFPVNSVKDIMALGKARPGYINLASAGGFQHFISALFSSQSGIKATILLYKGGFPAMIDVMGGQAHMLVGSLVSAIPHIRSTKLKPIATGGAQRTALLPELPTISEAGVPGYEASNFWAIATPAGTPPVIITRLNTETGALLKRPETQKRFTNEGAETDHRTPAEISKMMVTQLAKWAKVANDAGMAKE
jgi:tripartite-type tricarboxylate transporter receptor subunit TctC